MKIVLAPEGSMVWGQDVDDIVARMQQIGWGVEVGRECSDPCTRSQHLEQYREMVSLHVWTEHRLIVNTKNSKAFLNDLEKAGFLKQVVEH